ncbi:hypothetical protein [Hymenobacter terricola]|uniref:hypothetical protein n=1 Tax=Hymenobacter terricola TaxID=2819236 RepID=UPI001B303A39|nr:hypothetical protein [Hymenobacter terricola]
MLQFDTIKILFPRLLISDLDTKALTQAVDAKGKLIYYQRNSAPGLVTVRVGAKEIALEISAKILKVDYPKLISARTIEQVLFNAETLLPFTFDVHEALSQAHVAKCHQTQDLTLKQLFANYAAPLTQLFVSRDYTLKPYKDETVTFIQNTTGLDDKHREYFKLYDKAKEYKRATDANTAYRETLSKQEKELVSEYFADKMRMETQLNTKRKLRQYFPDIPKEIKLMDMLLSKSNPLLTQFTEITKQIYMAITNQTESKALSFTDSLTYDDTQFFYVLEKHDFNLKKIDYWLKQKRVKKPTQIRHRKKYAEMLASYKAFDSDSSSFAPLRELKDAITIGATVSNLEPTIPMAKATPATPITIATMVSKMEPSPTAKEVSEAIKLQDELFEKELAALPELEDGWLPF